MFDVCKVDQGCIIMACHVQTSLCQGMEGPSAKALESLVVISESRNCIIVPRLKTFRAVQSAQTGHGPTPLSQELAASMAREMNQSADGVGWEG